MRIPKNCEIVEIAHEIGRDDDEIERKDLLAEDPTTCNGVMSNPKKTIPRVGKLNNISSQTAKLKTNCLN